MPIYEYQCAQCGQKLEVMQKFSDPPLTRHETPCGGNLSKLLSLSAFHLKGSGWYATDYKKTSAPSKKEEGPATCGAAPTPSSPCATTGCAAEKNRTNP